MQTSTTRITGDELLLLSTMLASYIEASTDDDNVQLMGEALETVNTMKTVKNKIDQMLSDGAKLLNKTR